MKNHTRHTHMESNMNGKLPGTEEFALQTDLLNPFVHRLELSTTYDKIKVSSLS